MGLRGDATGAATSKKLTGPYCRAVSGDKEKEGRSAWNGARSPMERSQSQTSPLAHRDETGGLARFLR